MKFKNRYFSNCFLWLICIIVLNGGYSHEVVAQAADLSTEQLQQLEQLKNLSPEEQQKLADKAGVQPAAPEKEKEVEPPPIVAPRKVTEEGPPEREMATQQEAKEREEEMLKSFETEESDRKIAAQRKRKKREAEELKAEDQEKETLISPEAEKLERETIAEEEKKEREAEEREKEMLKSLAPRPPIEKLINKEAAERLELQRAFTGFLRESKPLSVDMDIFQFGYDLFAGTPTTFAPAAAIPVPPEYMLGPGDEIKVQLFGNKNDQSSMTVDREGAIAFPKIGPLTIAGMSFSEAKAFIAQQIKEKMIGVSASITMGKLRSIRIFALGEVERPGSYVVSGLATLSSALFVSGGVKKTGSLRNIVLKRNGKTVTTLDLYDFLLHGDTSKDVRLMPQDVVYVPPLGKTVGVAGQVLRPAIYELKSETAVADVLKLAGGLRPTAYQAKIQVERISQGKERIVLDMPLKGAGAGRHLEDGDIIKVFPILDTEENPIYLMGNVKRPGKYAWRKGMRMKELIHDTNALLPETYMKYGIIERESSVGREPMIIHFNLQSILEGKAQEALRPRDKVYIFHRAHFREQPKVTVTGRVQTPGDYELKKNMHLVDIVLAAGGLLRDADRDELELYHTDHKSREITVSRYSLVKALKGDETNNPLLQDMDRLVVHSIHETRYEALVSIQGEVKTPGEYVRAENMRVADLVFASGNVLESAYMKQAEITRYKIVNGEKRVSTHSQVDLEAALRGDVKANILLRPYDVLTIRKLAHWRDIENVTVEGEVRFTGVYPVEEGERLSDLITRVGGFTNKAYLRAAVFTRESIREQQQKQLDELAKRVEDEISRQTISITSIKDQGIAQRQGKSLESAKRILIELQAVKATGRLVIHLADAAELRDTDSDLRLRDGDRLYVPQRPDEVMVIGQVYNQTALLYRNELERNDYIDLAGGVTRFSDSGNIYVVRASGEVQGKKGRSFRRYRFKQGNSNGVSLQAKSIQPGDVIVVPEKLEQFFLIDSMLDWSRVLMQIGVGVASMRTLGIL